MKYEVGKTYTLTGDEPFWENMEPIRNVYGTHTTFPVEAGVEFFDEDGDICFDPVEGELRIYVHSSANNTYFWSKSQGLTEINPTGGDFSIQVEATDTNYEALTDYLFDPVQKPEHYNTNLPEGVEALDVIAAQTASLSGLHAVCQANVLKYVLRWQKKNGVEDLKKARFYLDRLIKEIENND